MTLTPDQKENIRQIERDGKELLIGLKSAQLAGAEPGTIALAIEYANQAIAFGVGAIGGSSNYAKRECTINTGMPVVQIRESRWQRFLNWWCK